MYGYYADLNTFNHDAIGWSYAPDASMQVKAGAKVINSDRGESFTGTVTAELEKTIGVKSGKGAFFGAFTLGAGQQDLAADIDLGLKYRLIGDYNKNIFVAGSVGANAGIVTGKMSAGVGAGLSAGFEYKNLTLTLGEEWNTNYKATTASVGFRF
jgi:hypothetical protein